MADIVIPAFLDSPSYDHTKILEDLRRMKTDRLLLAISYLDTDPDDRPFRDVRILAATVER